MRHEFDTLRRECHFEFGAAREADLTPPIEEAVLNFTMMWLCEEVHGQRVIVDMPSREAADDLARTIEKMQPNCPQCGAPLKVTIED